MSELTDAQRETLRAVCDTVVPRIERDDDPHGLWARRATDLGHRPGRRAAARADARRAAGRNARAARRPRAGRHHARLAALARADPENVALFGARGRRRRERADRHDAFLHYGAPDPETGMNPNWEAFGYPGPISAPPAEPKPIEPLVPESDELDARGRRLHRRLRRGRRRDRRKARPAAASRSACSRLAATSTSPTSTSSSCGPTRTCTGAAGPNPTADLNVTLHAGAGLGGGTVINWTNCLRTRPWVREQWATEHGLEGLDGPEFDRHLDAVFERLSVNDQCSDLNGPQQRMKEGADELGWSFKTILRNADRRSLRPGVGGLHGLRRPVGLEAEHPEDLPAGRRRRGRRHRRALLRRARAGRGRPRRRRRGNLDRPGDGPLRARDGARAAGRRRLRLARVAGAAAALRNRRPGRRKLPAAAPLHRAVRHLRRRPGGLVGRAAGRRSSTSSPTSRTATAS